MNQQECSFYPAKISYSQTWILYHESVAGSIMFFSVTTKCYNWIVTVSKAM